MATPFPFQWMLVDGSLKTKEDSSQFSIAYENVAIVGKMEGGFDLARPRTTRKARRIITTGFTDLAQVEYDPNNAALQTLSVLSTFYETVGQFGSVTYINPIDESTMTVRIVSWPEFEYVGIGGNHRWNLRPIKMKEV